MVGSWWLLWCICYLVFVVSWCLLLMAGLCRLGFGVSLEFVCCFLFVFVSGLFGCLLGSYLLFVLFSCFTLTLLLGLFIVYCLVVWFVFWYLGYVFGLFCCCCLVWVRYLFAQLVVLFIVMVGWVVCGFVAADLVCFMVWFISLICFRCVVVLYLWIVFFCFCLGVNAGVLVVWLVFCFNFELFCFVGLLVMVFLLWLVFDWLTGLRWWVCDSLFI